MVQQVKCFTLLLLIPLFTIQCKAGDPHYAGVMFYNVENLFDTIDNPATLDNEYTPGAEKHWNTERYDLKIQHIAKVISDADTKLPALVGLCEIENSSVLNDLINDPLLTMGNYHYVHFDSPDERGIDCALLYDTTQFTIVHARPIHVELPADNGGTTRDILFVEGILRIDSKKETIFLFINHWPSRVEGAELTASRRAIAAHTLKQMTDSLQQTLTNPKILIMGDFNDTPFDASIQKELGAVEEGSGGSANDLIDLMCGFQKNNQGSYNFKGNWQCLDQMIVSSTLIDGKKIDAKNAAIIKRDYMLYHNEQYGDSPNKTYSGGRYFGGYSDHLPVYLQLIFL